MTTRNYAGRVSILVATIALAGSCREAPTAFESEDQESRTVNEAVRLTFNEGTDQMPAWSADGDSILYSGAKLSGVPTRSNGIMLALSPEFGPSHLVFPELQSDVAFDEWLTSPAVSRDGKHIAFIEFYRLANPSLCSVGCPEPYEDIANRSVGFPELDSLRIRVFAKATRTVAHELTVRFNDRVYDLSRPNPKLGPKGTWVFDMKPYQARWARERTALFRPSWSPDGTRLVFSDGTQLLIWTIGQPTAQPIPNTTDAALPAWSPNGQMIAYTRAERGEILRTTCVCVDRLGQANEVQDRLTYLGAFTDGTLTVINPDGTNKREIGRGDAPAWTPSGQLVFRRDNALLMSTADGTNVTAIPGASGGNVPAVSPDGRMVAFAKRNNGTGGFDIWVAPLAGAQ